MPPSFTRGVFTIPLEIDGHNPWREARGMPKCTLNCRLLLRKSAFAKRTFAERKATIISARVLLADHTRWSRLVQSLIIRVFAQKSDRHRTSSNSLLD